MHGSFSILLHLWEGPKYGGGAATLTLCGKDLKGGWDLQVEMTEQHLNHSCKECVRVYKQGERDGKK